MDEFSLKLEKKIQKNKMSNLNNKIKKSLT